MASKKGRLIRRARETTRTPDPSRLLDDEVRGYRKVSISFYTPEFDWLEQTWRAMKRIGEHKANRSSVVQEAVQRLQADLRGKEAQEIVSNFREHRARRAQER